MSRLTPFFTPTQGTRKRAYVSGPMTGYKDHNFPAFDAASEKLRDLGYAVCSPADTSEFLGMDLDHSEFLRFDFEHILEADFLVALRGWESSMGALAELLMATRMGLKAWAWENFADFDLINAERVSTAIGVRANRPISYPIVPPALAGYFDGKETIVEGAPL